MAFQANQTLINMNTKIPSYKAKALLIACGFLSASYVAWAQNDPEDVIELSPFTIDASDDEGYYASQTMAGGRLSQSLKNTGASIQVITKDFMDDIGATSVEELLQYTTSSEVAGILGNFTGATTEGGGELSSDSARRDPDATSRIRGLAAPDRTRNFFITEIPFDSYNTERIDINRGANSFLFGLGTPAGLVNNGLAQARFKDSTEISTRVGSGGKDPSYRAHFKLNRILLEDKLAITVAGLYDRTQYRQRPTYKNDDRLYTAFTYRPFGNANTIVSGYFERGEQIGNAPDVLLPQHNLDTFLDGGQGIDYGDGSGPITNGDIVARRSIDVYDNLRYFNNEEGANNQKNFDKGIDRGSAQDPDGAFYRSIPRGDSLTHFNWGAGGYGFVFDGSNGRNPGFPYTPQYRGAEYNKGNTFWDPDNVGKGTPRQVHHGNRGEIGISGWQDQGFTNLDTFDFSRTNLGWDNDFYTRDFFNYNFALKQTFWEGKGGFELAYDYQDIYKGSYTAFNGGNARVIFDIQEKLLLPTQEYLNSGETGSRDGNLAGVIDNPNFGRPFVLTKSGRRSEDLQDETVRFTGFVKYDFADTMNSDNLGRLLGNHTLTVLADESTSDEVFVNWVNNSFGDGTFDPGHHIGPANARQTANNVRNTAVMAYIGPQQLDAFTDQSFGLSDFQLTPADYAIRLPSGYETQRLVWHLGDDVGASNFELRRDSIDEDGNVILNPISGNEDWKQVTHRVLEVPTKNYRLQQTKISSMAVNSQSMMLDNHLIVNMGYREDTVDNWLNTEANFYKDANGEDGVDEIADLRPSQFHLEDGNFSTTTSSVFGYGGVVYWPKDLIGLPEWIDDITFHYNESENFVPATDRVDQFRNKVDSPTGNSKDWGVSMYLFQNKVIARLNWYDAFLENARSPVSNLFNQINSGIFGHFSQLNQDIFTVDNDADGIVDDSFLTETFAYDPETGMSPEVLFTKGKKKGQVDIPAMTKDELVSEFYPYLTEAIAARASIEPALTDELKVAYNWRLDPETGVGRTQWAGQITDTNDIAAEGFEAELVLNPTKSWRISLNAAQQQTILTNIAPGISDLFENTWIPHLEQFGWLDWNTPIEPLSGSNTTRQLNSRMIDYFVAKAQEGKPTGEQREWRFNAVTNYTFREGPLKGFSIGGAYRWQDDYNSGYPLFANANDFIIPDVENAFKTPSESSIDLSFGYRKKIFENIDWKLQVNIRNLQNWNNTDLLIKSYQPDGTVARARFAPPRQILLTNTFKF